jgi:hypothetical protein
LWLSLWHDVSAWHSRACLIVSMFSKICYWFAKTVCTLLFFFFFQIFWCCYLITVDKSGWKWRLNDKKIQKKHFFQLVWKMYMFINQEMGGDSWSMYVLKYRCYANVVRPVWFFLTNKWYPNYEWLLKVWLIDHFAQHESFNQIASI